MCVCVCMYVYVCVCVCVWVCIYVCVCIYTGCPRRKGQNFGSVPYVKIYRYNPKHQYPKLNGYGDNGQRSLKL